MIKTFKDNFPQIFSIINNINCDNECTIKIEAFAYSLMYKDSKQENTILSYLHDLKLSIDFFIEYKNEDINLKNIKKLTRLDFRALYSKRKLSNISASSQVRLISAWKSFFLFLDYKNILSNLKIKTPKTFPKPISEEIIHDLLKVDSTWISYRNRALWGLLYGSGMRISEALSLNLNDWSENSDSLTIIGKGKVIRKVPLLRIVNKWIEEYLNIYPVQIQSEGPLFISKCHKRLSRQNCAHIFLKWRRKHGIVQKITPHTLRHSFASHVLGNDCNLKVLQDVLGHKNLETTTRYIKIEDHKLEKSFISIMDE